MYSVYSVRFLVAPDETTRTFTRGWAAVGSFFAVLGVKRIWIMCGAERGKVKDGRLDWRVRGRGRGEGSVREERVMSGKKDSS